MDELSFEGRVAVVTGSGRGIGRAHALLLAARGAKVVVNDLGGETDGTGAEIGPAHDVVEEIAAAGGTAVANGASVATVEGAESMVASALENFGQVDVIVNNAGILTTGEFVETGLEDFMRHLSVHLVGAFNVSRAAWPHMVKQGYGRIVSTTSTSFLGMTPIVSYASAKAGLIGLTRSLAVIGSEHGIKANLIAPLANTRMSGKTRGNGRKGDSSRAPIDREWPREPELVSPVVAFLCHDSCPVTGEIFSAGLGGVARLFIAETVGYTNLGITPEDVRDNWAAVMDETGYFVPDTFSAYSQNFRQNRVAQLEGAQPR